VPARDRARLGWWDGQTFHHVSARLRDLSGRGAALTLAEPPPPGAGSVWLCAEGRSPGDWVHARVLAVAEDQGGRRLVRLQFSGPCPNSLFRSALQSDTPSGTSLARKSVDDVLGDKVVPPPRPLLTGERTAAARRPAARPATTLDTEEWASLIVADLSTPPEPPRWADEKARMRAEWRAARWPWVITLTLNVVLSILLGVMVAERMAHLNAIKVLEIALGRG
jgi:hypothetical protein